MMKKRVGILTLFLLFLTVMFLPVTSKAYEDKDFYYRVKSKKAIITACAGTNQQREKIVVPSKLGGFPVTGIGYNAFVGSRESAVTLPDTIETIDTNAFANMTKLKKIKLPSSLKKLGRGAFFNCTSLESVQFNSKLEKLEDDTFSNCISLKKISLPNSVRYIGQEVFRKCYKLSSVKLGNHVMKIGRRAFYKNYALKSVIIPKSAKKVEEKAFEKCEDLRTVRFMNEKTKLDDGVFYKCTSLKQAYLPAGIKNVPAYTFFGCSGLTKFSVPKGVSFIKKYAFYNCSKLKSARMNQRVYAIGDWAFAKSGLRSVKLNDNMQFIGNGAFQATNIRSLALKSKVAFIGNRVFADCEALKKISIPASVKGINPGAFNNCVSLQAINVASGNKDYSSEAGVLYNKNKSRLIQYPLGKRSKNFRTPGSLEEIRAHAFAGNGYLQNVTVTAVTIGRGAFENMSDLRKVTMTGRTKKIGDVAFRDSTKLSTVALPDSVQTIGELAFANSRIRRFHIPSRLIKLGPDAFYECNSLSAFVGGRGSRYSVQDGVLYNSSRTKLIQYPAKKSDKTFTVPNSVKKVASYSFYKTAYLTKLYFPVKFKTLDYHAIQYAKNLKSVVFTSKKMGGYSSTEAIVDCGRLAVIVGPNTYTMRAMADSANATLISL